MVTLRSARVLDATSTSVDNKPAMRNRSPSSGSSSSSSDDLVTYEEEAPFNIDANVRKERRTTRQKVDRRPKSTFWKKPRSEMTLAERICSLAIVPETMHYIVDEKEDRGPVPYHSAWKENLFIWPRAAAPLVIQYIAHQLTGSNWSAWAAYPFYVVSYMAFALTVMARLNSYCVKYGTMNEKNIGRDRTPDHSVGQLAFGVTSYMFLRTGMDFYMHYDKNVTPLTDISWTYPLRLMAWQIAFDYFFYCYHRSSHEVDALWWIHQKHHTTKQPTAILAILADDFQESLEIFFIPLMASLLVPMSFSEMWLTLQVTIYVEMLGHSGVRAYWAHPTLNSVLALFDAELIVEDHDLHHRYGKSGRNYGKQTRIWDRIFGTTGERIECYGMNGHTPGNNATPILAHD
ncbi:hypothetical protein OIO90_005516 [Microbotryomycetes sp. JL221]|nr:hypothetical protein OIO90_005516 [Microbotryomycetes sp. JL221]